jgi:hypothetical protein
LEPYRIDTPLTEIIDNRPGLDWALGPSRGISVLYAVAEAREAALGRQERPGLMIDRGDDHE